LYDLIKNLEKKSSFEQLVHDSMRPAVRQNLLSLIYERLTYKQVFTNPTPWSKAQAIKPIPATVLGPIYQINVLFWPKFEYENFNKLVIDVTCQNIIYIVQNSSHKS